MATPLSADRLLKALRDEGLRVVEHRSWRTHNRNHMGPWGPLHGVMIHHTVTSGTQNSVDLCYDGYASLPGPLCHGVIAKDGTVHLVGNGRANHAGLGDDDVLRAVINESAPLPADNEANTDGNRHFYGFECINLGDGEDPWPAAQLEAIEKAAAAICRAHGWTQRSVIGHKEWQPGKVDPRGFTMDSMRGRIAERLRVSPPGPKPPARYEPFPGAAFFARGRRSPIITAMGKRLVAEGCGRYEVGPGPEWSEADRASYAAWQRKLGYSGSAADGIPGKASWDKLKVPNV
ncbi:MULTISPECIES: peptidoglycan-binding protein [unclassified Streptomyces]|uniref:peptidoglycan-binding protein n=1 Tax=unclassified Streptomyces TaxID=2593676 RepID=UPI00364CC13F